MQAAAASRQPFFSIVIPTLNEAKHLPLLLADLTAQSNSDFEVVHVDGDSDDETVKLAKSFQKKIAIKSYVVKERNVSFQRNFGAKKAKGTWIIFMDADNRLPNYFLDGIKYQLAKNPDTDTFTTWVKVEDEKKLYQPIEKTINFGFELFRNIGQEAAFGALIGVHKTVFAEIQFDTKQKVYEDALFLQEAVDRGYQYDIYREPRYIYSLRRLKKEGTIKMVHSSGKLILKFLQGADFSEDNYGYEMKGGGYYESDAAPLFIRLNNYFRSASKKQLQQARKILNSLKELEIS